MEIERKFLIKKLPEDLSSYAFHDIEQGYLSREPVVRIRKEDDKYYLTYKAFRGYKMDKKIASFRACYLSFKLNHHIMMT